jgi:hypothetical protein
MKATDYISFTIDRLPKGYVFTYADFGSEVKSKEAIIKALNRMVVAGKIAKLSKGKYYKPESTVFGNLEPNQYQVVKDLLEDGNKITGYLTGYSMYSKLGLTTQISNTIQIGKNEIRPSLKRIFCHFKMTFLVSSLTKKRTSFSLDLVMNISHQMIQRAQEKAYISCKISKWTRNMMFMREKCTLL